MTPITTVAEILKLQSGDYVGYYAPDLGVKVFSIAKVCNEPNRIVLKAVDSIECAVFPSRTHFSNKLQEDVFIEKTAKRWAELGLQWSKYPAGIMPVKKAEEIVFELTDEELLKHVVAISV